MERENQEHNDMTPRRRSYQLILSYIQDCRSLDEQRLFIESLLYQCALLAKMTAGEKEFQALLNRLRFMSFDELETATALESKGVHVKATRSSDPHGGKVDIGDKVDNTDR